MSATSIWIMILCVSAVSLLPRILPVALFSRFEFPKLLQRWLSFVAPAVLGGLTAISVLAPSGTIDISLQNRFIWAFIPTLLVAIKTRSLFWTLAVGIMVMALLYHFL